jgi:hypothetical protein
MVGGSSTRGLRRILICPRRILTSSTWSARMTTGSAQAVVRTRIFPSGAVSTAIVHLSVFSRVSGVIIPPTTVFSYLTTIPFDTIKIDRSFTLNMLDRADCATILSAVVALGRDLKTETVAEGVETEQQFNAVCAAGVTLVQGYLFGVPCPASDLVLDSSSADLIGSAA